jgi:hypothetical protein
MKLPLLIALALAAAGGATAAVHNAFPHFSVPRLDVPPLKLTPYLHASPPLFAPRLLPAPFLTGPARVVSHMPILRPPPLTADAMVHHPDEHSTRYALTIVRPDLDVLP